MSNTFWGLGVEIAMDNDVLYVHFACIIRFIEFNLHFMIHGTLDGIIFRFTEYDTLNHPIEVIIEQCILMVYGWNSESLRGIR